MRYTVLNGARGCSLWYAAPVSVYCTLVFCVSCPLGCTDRSICWLYCKETVYDIDLTLMYCKRWSGCITSLGVVLMFDCCAAVYLLYVVSPSIPCAVLFVCAMKH